jgi:hypothetical protein
MGKLFPFLRKCYVAVVIFYICRRENQLGMMHTLGREDGRRIMSSRLDYSVYLGLKKEETDASLFPGFHCQKLASELLKS